MKVLFKLSKKIWHVWISWLKNYLPELQIWIRLLVSWQFSKLAVDFHVKLISDKIFSLEYWTNSFKTELLSVILSHSGIKFDFLFNFTQSMTKSNWSFEDFWLTCFDYCAAIVDEVVAKNKRKIEDPWTEKWSVFLRKETD